MKKLLLISAAMILFGGLALRAYFTLVPPPEPTLHEPLALIVPDELEGWEIKDLDMAESPESSARISEFLNFDDALFRVFQKNDVFVGLYIAYWTPGKASYRWAGAHTPDTCWVVNGWTREEREYSIPFTYNKIRLEPAEFGVYSKDGSSQNVYFWHLVGGEPFSYDQTGTPNILGALLDVKEYGLNLREEQFFIRLSSNKNLDELKKTPGFKAIIESLVEVGLEEEVSAAAAPLASTQL
ncbi:exosortase-associated EpsI family protein [Coraliomargarita sp. SDUM461004]|uniref:Exosortase-associated EpsI family protein n=1 Tax=Thalassobacterium sedimentorum TaxID=3041258 RepID=A0ABU1AFT7_9BACT|nr:exosortase-associated EpsI family protein [Coraliomargarita sp. SDUM461004]MDQ8193574.1 exosortase-associated EpsI family protein [Coraliomargarita sp. SDUM461004]